MTIDIRALSIALSTLFIFYLLYKRTLSQEKPKVYFSSLSTLKKVADNKGFIINDRKHLVLLLSLILMALALINPKTEISPRIETQATDENRELKTLPKEGVAIYLLLDKSSSMGESLPTKDGTQERLIDMMKSVSKEFIKERANDIISVIAFARTADILVPPTFDKGSINKALEGIDSLSKRNKENSTQIGYAVYKTALLFDALNKEAKKRGGYQINHGALILISDGIQTTHPDDENNPYRTISLDDAALAAKKAGLRLYMVNLLPEINDDKYALQVKQMKRVSDLTGGKFFPITSPDLLSKVYKEIDSIEKSAIEQGGEISQTKQTIIFHTYYKEILLLATLFFILLFYFDYHRFLRIP